MMVFTSNPNTRERQALSVSSRAAWFIEVVPGQGGHREILYQKEGNAKKEIKIRSSERQGVGPG